jgi:hypothetical protein
VRAIGMFPPSPALGSEFLASSALQRFAGVGSETGGRVPRASWPGGSCPFSAPAASTRPRKIEFSFLKINLVVPAGPLPISILDDKSAKEI